MKFLGENEREESDECFFEGKRVIISVIYLGNFHFHLLKNYGG